MHPTTNTDHYGLKTTTSSSERQLQPARNAILSPSLVLQGPTLHNSTLTHTSPTSLPLLAATPPPTPHNQPQPLLRTPSLTVTFKTTTHISAVPPPPAGTHQRLLGVSLHCCSPRGPVGRAHLTVLISELHSTARHSTSSRVSHIDKHIITLIWDWAQNASTCLHPGHHAPRSQHTPPGCADLVRMCRCCCATSHH